jgi:thiopeptide-type bacteriocin biosynthesis protein
VLPARDVPPGEVRRRIGERFGDYLSRNPSHDRVSAAQYAGFAPRLAGLEDMRSWSTQLYPNNSVSFIAYEREHERYGYGTSIQAVERHFVESSRIALRVLTRAVPAERRLTLGLACVLAAWFVGCSDLGALRSWLGDRYPGRVGNLASVVRLARTTRHLAEEGADGDGALAYWTRSITDLRAVLAAVPGTVDGVLPVLDLCAHLICNRLGLSLVAEGTLRQLAAQAVDSLHRDGSVMRAAGR